MNQRTDRVEFKRGVCVIGDLDVEPLLQIKAISKTSRDSKPIESSPSVNFSSRAPLRILAATVSKTTLAVSVISFGLVGACPRPLARPVPEAEFVS